MASDFPSVGSGPQIDVGNQATKFIASIYLSNPGGVNRFIDGITAPFQHIDKVYPDEGFILDDEKWLHVHDLDKVPHSSCPNQS